ncbi:MAG: transglycosylase domain-containing protein [Bacilli bacterium]|nr:transglycosylase domain-containing protein [Bacilli bacterium]
MNKFVKKLQKNPHIMIIIISLIIFLIAGITINWIISFIAVGLVDLLIMLPKLRKKKAKKQKGKKKKKKILKIILIIFFVFVIIGIILMCFFFYIIVKNAPEFDPDQLYEQESTILYNSDGEIYAKLGTENRENITYDEVAEVLIDAVVATEDSRFFQHDGFDLLRFLKASFYQLLGHSDAGGASTLTMQLSKQYYTSTTSTGIEGIVRKFTDIYMAVFKIEKQYTKKEILEFYLNSNYLGAYQYGGAYGVEQACQTYFGKSAKDINLAEAALIAGLFNAPTALDPYVNPEGAEARRKVVLSLMERHGYITAEEREAAEAVTVEDLIIQHDTNTSEYQGFIDTVVQEVIDVTGNNPYETPMIIYTTMDKDKQDYVNAIVNGETFTWANDEVNAGIAIVDVDTGALLAVGAGRNKTGVLSINYATFHSPAQKRQIGSTAKPLYDYGPGIEYNNWSTYTPFVDEEYTYSTGTSINNWDGKYYGFMTMREALAASRNIPALKAFQKISNSKIKSFVLSLGLSPEIEDGIVHEAHAIGGYNGESPVSMASAYAAFANGGYYNEPYSFTKIIYRDTNEEYTQKTTTTKTMSESTAYMITDMLIDTAKSALSNYSNVNGKIYGAKTGTTNFSTEAFELYNLPYGAVNDLWVVGYNTEYSIAVWYGYDTINKDYVNYYNTRSHAKLFQAVAKGIFTSDSDFTKPDDVIEVNIEKETYPGMLASEYTPSDMITTELYKEGSEPTEVSNRYSQLDNVTNLNSNINNNILTLTWDAIDTPDAIDNDYLTSFFQSLYSNKNDQTNYLNKRLSYNNTYIGELGYNIYQKVGSELELIGFTKNASYNININNLDNTLTFVVKSTYTIFKNNASSGTEITITNDNHSSLITSELNGDANISVDLGSDYTYQEVTPAIIVKENGLDVASDDVTITTVVTKNSDNSVISLNQINALTEETYTITYNVSYGDYTEVHTRTITIS